MAQSLWLIPLLPLLAAVILVFAPEGRRRVTVGVAVGAITASWLLACLALGSTLGALGGGEALRETVRFTWMEMGPTALELSWVLDPLTAVMLVMVTSVSGTIFVYSAAYMEDDPGFNRFFMLLCFFSAAMLGVVIANHLLLLFICWELVGLASFLLIGFWYQRPSAVAAAKKAFITTRLGDLGLFLGMLWLYSESGTLMFYDQGRGCLEGAALNGLVAQTAVGGMTVATAIGLLMFLGAAGKSGQVPLHVWLPDAMEGPTPVSALIHAATMVAAGVFLIARIYPLMDADPAGAPGLSPALTVVTWTGAVTAFLAACIAVAQFDIKRILAYSTVSQLGYMMMGLGAGGVAVGMFHLITHAFFKALLFLGAGSVIHGCHGEQDIRRMGGLKGGMPVTFVTYAIGMMALAGVPVFFSGFWSKDEILHAAWGWPPSNWPFYLGTAGVFLTAFYMVRQMGYVFFGSRRGEDHEGEPAAHDRHVHESPRIMTVPLIVLAVISVGIGFLGTPLWPAFQGYLQGETAHWGGEHLAEPTLWMLWGLSILLVAAGMVAAWRFYGALPGRAEGPDPLEQRQPAGFELLRERLYFDEVYAATVGRGVTVAAEGCDWLDRQVWGGLVRLVTGAVLVVSWANRLVDEWVFNSGFDLSCLRIRRGGGWVLQWQNGRVQSYLRVIGVAIVVMMLLLSWGCGE